MGNRLIGSVAETEEKWTGRRLGGKKGMEVSNKTVGAIEVGEGCGEFVQEGKVMLTRGKWGAYFRIVAMRSLWSVKRVKGWPPRKKQKWWIERYVARSSQSKVV
jgi:hypothetical protein